MNVSEKDQEMMARMLVELSAGNRKREQMIGLLANMVSGYISASVMSSPDVAIKDKASFIFMMADRYASEFEGYVNIQLEGIITSTGYGIHPDLLPNG